MPARMIHQRRRRRQIAGAITYAELARLDHISPARLTQIMVLVHLAPAIQEYILFLSPGDAAYHRVGVAQDRAGAALGSPACVV